MSLLREVWAMVRTWPGEAWEIGSFLIRKADDRWILKR